MLSESLTEPWRYRELLLLLAWREIQVRYKQAALGAAWAVVQPLLTMVTFTFFFGHLAGIPSNGVPYPIFSYAALVLWTYATGTMSQAGNSLVSNSDLITKVYFPRVFLPGASALGNMLDLAIGIVVLAIMFVYYRIELHGSLVLAPLFVLELVLLVLGVSMMMAAMNVRYRDIKYTIPFVLQLWLFITPVIYPTSFLPRRYQTLIALNPMTGIIEGFRACIFPNLAFDWRVIGLSWVSTLAVLALGALYFLRTQREFADIV